MITIICVYNNAEKLDRYLLKSLREQNVSYELITIDNTEGQYNSAAEILNETAEKAKGDYLMFVHQDVELSSITWLMDVEDTVRKLRRFGAAGVAGRNSRGRFRAMVWTGSPPFFLGSEKLKKPMRAQTVDGALIITPADLFRQVRFDEKVCSGWYFYVAEYCLQLSRYGRGVYVMPHEVYHESPGPSDPEVYADTVAKILEKHRDHVEVFHTTMDSWNTGCSLWVLLNVRMRNVLKWTCFNKACH